MQPRDTAFKSVGCRRAARTTQSMSYKLTNSFRASAGRIGPILVLAAVGALAACSKQQPGAAYNDPLETTNRQVHKFNTALDSTFFGTPEKKGILPIIPKPVTIGFSNFSSNLGMPSAVVNNLLQGKPIEAADDTLRFAVNTTVGIGGLFDPASVLGLDAKSADFGGTLHAWGAPEGAYLEVPFLGPSTERDFAGTIVDILTDPANNLVSSRDRAYITGIRLGAKVGNRQRFAQTYESILYDSADSYAQSRLIYLQNRHFELGEEDQVFDPNEDPYAQ